MSIAEHKEVYTMHGYEIEVTANFLISKIELQVTKPVNESVSVPMSRYENFYGDMRQFVESCLNKKHELYKA